MTSADNDAASSLTDGAAAASAGTPDPLYVAARRVLLDALLALHAHGDAVIAADARSVSAKVAGPAALLIAKAHKLNDRLRGARVDRLVDKDAADVLRLMQTFDPAEIGAVFVRLGEERLTAAPSQAALIYLEQLFGRCGARGVEMATRALGPGVQGGRIEALCVAYTAALLSSIEG